MKKILILITIIITSCTNPIMKNKTIVSKITNDSLKVERVDIIEESNYYNVITNLDAVIKSSIDAWEDSPELGQYNRIKTIKIVTDKFIKKLNDGNYQNDDKVTAYQFIKSNGNKRYLGYAVVIFDKDGKQSTLYYEIKNYSNYYNGASVNKLITRGLSDEINTTPVECNNECL